MGVRSDRDLCEWIDEHGKGVTSWEASFLDSVLKRLDRGDPLSEKQRKVLDRIYEDRCAG